jgi:hypothetical protein
MFVAGRPMRGSNLRGNNAGAVGLQSPLRKKPPRCKYLLQPQIFQKQSQFVLNLFAVLLAIGNKM